MSAPPTPFDAVLTPDRERALATTIRAGRRARLLAQRHLAARLRRELPPAVNARAAAAAVLAALRPRLPLAPDVLPVVVGPLLPRALDDDARARVLADLAAWPLDQDALRAGDAARAAFVVANQRLVVAVARRYQQRGLPLDDLVQEGTVGLLRAVDLFDPARGYKFSTYAVWWIKQAMRRALARQVLVAHVPATGARPPRPPGPRPPRRPGPSALPRRAGRRDGSPPRPRGRPHCTPARPRPPRPAHGRGRDYDAG